MMRFPLCPPLEGSESGMTFPVYHFLINKNCMIENCVCVKLVFIIYSCKIFFCKQGDINNLTGGDHAGTS